MVKMVEMVEMDDATTFRRQLATKDEGPIVLVNRFHVPAEYEQEFMKLWQDDAHFMMTNGCISAQMHKGIEGSGSYLNVAVWESAQALARAFGNPQFQGLISRYGDGCTASPHIFKRIAVPGVCVA